MPSLVGIDKRCQHIEWLLKKFTVVGIWGRGGVGKTTIAKIVFGELSTQFESCCFCENVGQESKKYGLYNLRDKLLNELFKEENPHISRPRVTESTHLLKSLRSKKVLIVLDDVDDSNQLEYLTKECNNLGAGSRVIITTRDKNFFAGVKVDKIYEVNELNSRESLQLLCLHAFNQNSPKMGYKVPSTRVAFYCEGNPLALKVLGSFLRYKIIEEWESVLAKLDRIPNKDIRNVLRLSYDGLDSPDKEIFLYIAFFLNGEDIEHVIQLIASLGYSSVAIENLQDRALVNISDNRVWMHDLIQKMGREIFCEQYTEESGRHSRSEDSKDTHVFKESLVRDVHPNFPDKPQYGIVC